MISYTTKFIIVQVPYNTRLPAGIMLTTWWPFSLSVVNKDSEYISLQVFGGTSWINSSPPNAAYMRQWIRVNIGSDNGLSPIRHQAII